MVPFALLIVPVHLLSGLVYIGLWIYLDLVVELSRLVIYLLKEAKRVKTRLGFSVVASELSLPV